MIASFSSQAVEAAGAQGELWRMHDLIFERQNELSKNLIYQIADEIGLDKQKFKHDLESHKFKDRVKRDIRMGTRSGVHQTPTFFLNQTLYQGNSDYKSLSRFIDDELERIKNAA